MFKLDEKIGQLIEVDKKYRLILKGLNISLAMSAPLPTVKLKLLLYKPPCLSVSLTLFYFIISLGLQILKCLRSFNHADVGGWFACRADFKRIDYIAQLARLVWFADMRLAHSSLPK